MSIDPEILEGLRPGDVVRFRHEFWPDLAYQEGSVYVGEGGDLWCGGVRLSNWSRYFAEFEAVSRKPRFYANADREPVAGDLATTKWHDSSVGPWFYTDRGWFSPLGRPISGDMPPVDNILLYDAVKRRPVTP